MTIHQTDDYLALLGAVQENAQAKFEKAQMKRAGREVREAWLAEARQDHFRKKHARLAVLERVRAEKTAKLKIDNQVRRQVHSQLVHDSQMRVLYEEEHKRHELLSRHSLAEQKRVEAEAKREAVVHARNQEFADKRVGQQMVRERAVEQFEKKQHGARPPTYLAVFLRHLQPPVGSAKGPVAGRRFRGEAADSGKGRPAAPEAGGAGRTAALRGGAGA